MLEEVRPEPIVQLSYAQNKTKQRLEAASREGQTAWTLSYNLKS